MQAYSVLMAVYYKENAEYFRASIESMFNQTIKPEEIVIVEDGPLTDALYQVIEDYSAAEPALFTIVPIEKNSGLANALNEGLKVCRNEMVARMDTDDLSVPERCEKELLCFEAYPELSLVGSNMDEFEGQPEHVVSVRTVPSDEAEILRFGRRRNPFNHPTIMYKKSDVLQFGGYNTARRRGQDFELFVSMVHSGYHAKNLEESLVKFRIDADSVQRKKSWSHCKTHIDIVSTFWKRGYSSVVDLCVVSLGACMVHLVPPGVVQAIYNNFLRRQ